ncbi:hypothetical protein AJ79_05155 [Helicocarpus griseus UAMH5409]|uniref:Phosphatidylglycerol/phosphatidylinositol transfer protein n=1 Tax=Helicocarpus griseus UAMH5409 TaxID=1447875 RepID=A0A2B7XGZ6_9EURO|nr:hypothetical protein AJ79_05155 [Helicocarpus griseus UAMH5409]
MHLTASSIVALFCSSLAVAAPSLQFLAEQQTPLGFLNTNNHLSVPGNNPLTYCSAPDNDILTIESVDLSPSPPVPGQTLTINATGTFHQQVDEGAKVQVQVNYGFIRLINKEADLCTEIKNVDLNCPLKKGNMSFTKSVDLPKEIPPGQYTVMADVYTKNQERITCLQAQVTFNI